MTRGSKDKLNYDPGKDKISPSELVGGDTNTSVLTLSAQAPVA